MALIQGQKAIRSSSGGKNDERCVRKADPKIPVPTDHLSGLLYVFSGETLQPIRAPRDLAEEKELRGGTDPIQQQIVNLRSNEGRQEERARVSFEGSLHIFVSVLVGVDKSQKPARIENDHSPKPLSASSTRSARCGSPLRKRPGVGRGLSTAVRFSRASRINEASDRPRRRASRPRRRFSSVGR